MDMSIRRHRFLKDGTPIYVPTCEDSAWITRDSEKKWLSRQTRWAQAITGTGSRVSCELYDGVMADFETVPCL
jgi:hypothetical protein